MKHYTLLYLAWAAMCLTSCLDEHPKDQLGEDAIYGSASEIYTNAVASLYNYIGSANESEGIQGTCRGVYDYNPLTTDWRRYTSPSTRDCRESPRPAAA